MAYTCKSRRASSFPVFAQHGPGTVLRSCCNRGCAQHAAEKQQSSSHGRSWSNKRTHHVGGGAPISSAFIFVGSVVAMQRGTLQQPTRPTWQFIPRDAQAVGLTIHVPPLALGSACGPAQRAVQTGCGERVARLSLCLFLARWWAPVGGGCSQQAPTRSIKRCGCCSLDLFFHVESEKGGLAG